MEKSYIIFIMGDEKIKVHIGCQNIAPIENLASHFAVGALKIGVFANNGSGKTFISRLFRLMDYTRAGSGEVDSDSTDYLLRLGCNSGKFNFQISDKTGNIVENMSFEVHKHKRPEIPNSYYIYHVFNQDYVEENIRVLDYEKDSNIQGYILGKSNIDLTDDEEKLKGIKDSCENLKSQIEMSIQTYLNQKIDSIRDIRRLQEYGQLLNIEAILDSGNRQKPHCSKTIQELLVDYNKIKSVPDNLANISPVNNLTIKMDLFEQIIADLKKAYTLSSFSEDFKTKIRNKQTFIEDGLKLYMGGICPFCEQEMTTKSIALIDNYTKFLNDSEAQTIRLFRDYEQQLKTVLSGLSAVEHDVDNRMSIYNDYKTRYIPTLENENLESVSSIIISLQKCIRELLYSIDKKKEAINVPIEADEKIFIGIRELLSKLIEVLERNNQKIDIINTKKNKITEENKTIRRDICKAAYVYLSELHENNIVKYTELQKQYKELNLDISKRKETERVSKKKQVYETIKNVLDYFFSGKYTLREDDFHLIFKDTSLNKGQVKHILSEGEKNIIAFAYYLGDVHLKMSTQEDYNKIFFIIDDPISSMDFTYVYTLCGIIREIKQILQNLQRERFIILTHNNDFMRILCANNIVEKRLLLRNGTLLDFNENFTVPYISHLLDIYKIARKGEKANHTTANSIRHIIETLTKFQNIDVSNDSIAAYIKANIPQDKKSYTFINDLSHGGWRSEQPPMTDEDYTETCETIIAHIEKAYPNQIKYCERC